MEENNFKEKKKIIPILLVLLLLLIVSAGVAIYLNNNRKANATFEEENLLDNTIADENSLNNTSVDENEIVDNTTVNEEENLPTNNASDTTANTNTVNANKNNVIPPMAIVSYSTAKQTTGSVTVTITSNQELKSVKGWTLSTDKTRLTKVYKVNSTENITIESLAGVKNTVVIKVDNINK